jgi:ABC-type antimicrobial peptide transport system permease subunit
MPAFYQSKLKTLQPYDDVMFEEWAVAMHKDIPAYAVLMGYNDHTACAAYLYRGDNGVYPTDGELASFMESNADRIEQMADNSRLLSSYDRYMEQHWNGMSKNYYIYIVSDADYVRLVSGAGSFENVLMESPYNVWDYGDGPYYSNHLLIHSSDPAATAAFLAEILGEDGFIRPDGVFEQIYAEIRTTVIVTVVTELAVIALMCLCVFFIMRSSFMSRVREVGILRAIGVTKKNLTFRFAVETALLLLLTVVPGYALSSWFIGSMSDAAFISEMFFFPLWIALPLFAVILTVSMVFGVLPALTLLRKTPSEILSKYDI